MVDTTLLDDLKRNPAYFQLIKDKFAKEIRAAMPKARLFVFDDDASRIMGNFVRECGDIILKNEQFAIPLFDDMYIEFNIEEFLEALHAPQTADHTDVSRDIRIGYLFSNGMIYTIFKTNEKTNLASFSGMAYSYSNNPILKPFEGFDTGEQLALTISRRKKAERLLGSTLQQAGSVSEFQNIAEKYTIGNIYKSDISYEQTSGSNGDIRNVITMLLFLYQHQTRNFVDFSHQAARRGIIKGKLQSFYAYNKVTIHLQSKDFRKSFSVIDRASPRRHDVRPFYRTTPKRSFCDHDFKEIVPQKKWVCTHCNAIRVRIEKHMRGDSTKGFVYKAWEVTK